MHIFRSFIGIRSKKESKNYLRTLSCKLCKTLNKVLTKQILTNTKLKRNKWERKCNSDLWRKTLRRINKLLVIYLSVIIVIKMPLLKCQHFDRRRIPNANANCFIKKCTSEYFTYPPDYPCLVRICKNLHFRSLRYPQMPGPGATTKK